MTQVQTKKDESLNSSQNINLDEVKLIHAFDTMSIFNYDRKLTNSYFFEPIWSK